jgi:hypothetical protein
MSKTTTRLLAASAIALAAAAFSVPQVYAAGGESGRDFNENSGPTNPGMRQAPPSQGVSGAPPTPSNPDLRGTAPGASSVPPAQSGVPAQCQSITNPTDRQACINRVK